MPTPHRPTIIEASYPATYRDHEVTTLIRAIRSRQSSMVCGLGGSGKSHLLRFLAFHAAIEERLGTLDLRRLYLDCNSAISDDAAGIFRALLLEAGAADTIPHEAPDLLVTLRTALAAEMTPTTRFVIVIDRIERIAANVQPAVLDGLRHLRDYLDRRVSYVLGSRMPLPIAAISEEFDDLLADPPVVWVWPLAPGDAAWNVAAVLAELGEAADADTVAELIALSGGYPRLLRTIALAWVDLAPADRTNLEAALLVNRQVTRVCEAIYRDLDQPSQTILQRLAAGDVVEVSPRHLLRVTGIVRVEGERRTIFSPIFAAYVRTIQPLLLPDLTALEHQLWELLAARPNDLLRRDDLIAALYGDNPDGINDEALTALVARLRRKLVQANKGMIEAVRGLGYRFTPTAGTVAPQ